MDAGTATAAATATTADAYLEDALARLRRVATAVHDRKAAAQKARADAGTQDWVKLYDEGEVEERQGEAGQVAASQAALALGVDPTTAEFGDAGVGDAEFGFVRPFPAFAAQHA